MTLLWGGNDDDEGKNEPDQASIRLRRLWAMPRGNFGQKGADADAPVFVEVQKEYAARWVSLPTSAT